MTGIADKLKGKAKEVAGKVSGDRRTETEGQTDQVKGEVKQTASDLEQRAKGVADSLSQETDGKPGDPASADRAGPRSKPSPQP